MYRFVCAPQWLMQLGIVSITFVPFLFNGLVLAVCSEIPVWLMLCMSAALCLRWEVLDLVAGRIADVVGHPTVRGVPFGSVQSSCLRCI